MISADPFARRHRGSSEARHLRVLLGESSDAFADRIAVRDPARGEDVTYRDLDAAATKIAKVLTEMGVRAGDRVGLCASKSIALVAAVFGVLEIGAAYVPVDTGAPVGRNATIFDDCAVAAIVSVAPMLGQLCDALVLGTPAMKMVEVAGVALSVVRVPTVQPPSVTADPASEHELAYILYTSGSTGRPKGVAHSHASALAFVDWASETFQPTAEDSFSSHAPFHFDLSIFDLFVCIKHGAMLLVIDEVVAKRPAELASLIAEEGISVWYSTPSVLRFLLRWGNLDQLDLSSLRLVNFAGETFPHGSLRDLMGVVPSARFFNLYGPTETNVCTFHEVQRVAAELEEPLPIGRPCSGDRCLVAREDGTVTALGEVGELWVSGPSVMLGYWQDREANERSFHVDGDGNRWYKTGDLVQQTVSGEYLFKGRRDRMVKRRGYRIELAEIEAALESHDAIANVAVVAQSVDDDISLAAFLVCRDDNRPSIVAMKQHCAALLPLYMVPDNFVFVGELPTTSTDKVDYQRLRALI